MISLILNTDGGSRGNPGPAACGAVIFDAQGTELHRLNKTIGTATNNQAEYQALVMGLELIKAEYKQSHVTCRLDSELVVRQLLGQYKMKNAELKPLYQSVLQLAREIGSVRFEHVPREHNKLADKLVNDALDGL